MSIQDVKITLVESEADLKTAAKIPIRCFGDQTADGIYRAMNPGWYTPEGIRGIVERTVSRWKATTRDRNGDLNTMFVIASVPDPNRPSERVIAGLAIWTQLSMIEGFGDRPVENLAEAMDLEALYPGQPEEHKFLIQLDRGIHRRRIQIVKEKAATDLPAVLVLDVCAVEPDFQRRGIAQKLVQWGLDQAKRRGGLECITEASPMGTGAYAKLGFKEEGGEMDYGLDEQFQGRSLSSNVLMRTGNPSLA